MIHRGDARRNFLALLGKVLITIVLPVWMLNHFSRPEAWGVKPTLAVALALPLAYGIYELGQTKKVSWLAILGIISVGATGGISWLGFDPTWLAIKEAAVPALIGGIILGSQFTRQPLIKLLIGQLLDLEQVEAVAESKGTGERWGRRLRRATYLAAGSFFVSAVLNFTLAKLIVTSQPGTVAFNQELARLTAWSYPAIALPALLLLAAAIGYLIIGLEKDTGLTAEEWLTMKSP